MKDSHDSNQTILDVFQLRNGLVDGYQQFSRGFTKISAADIKGRVNEEYEHGRYWSEPLIQINPNYKRAETVQRLGTSWKQVNWLDSQSVKGDRNHGATRL